ncbi:MAG: MFS transporter [Tannerellaceae bacterium]|jgi:PAT family beta-lactamase induction signal transducer AmpG|nr:MFS transporter [Tannerellaceae bacterium]
MKNLKAWGWVPSLFFAEGLPYVAVMTVSAIMYKKLGVSNAALAYYTAWLYLPWVIKPLWSPFVDLIKNKRWWIVSMQLLMGGGLAGIAYSIPTTFFFQTSLAFFWLLAFSSATHDIAADGFYLLGLKREEQAFFIGIRNMFYRFAVLTGQGSLIMLAGMFESYTGRIPYAWSIIFLILAFMMLGAGLWHRHILPKPAEDEQKLVGGVRFILREFGRTFVSFFQKEGVCPALIFMLTFRLGESQLVKMNSPFLLDSENAGGLALATEQLGLANTSGMIALVLGGISGGIVISKCGGLKSWLWPMTLALFLPNLVYLYMSIARPESLWTICACVSVEQLGYGFGFTAYVMFMMLFAEGKYKTSHYAICTAFMALGMMLPGMASGWIQEQIGYVQFFIWVILCGLPVFGILPFLKINTPIKMNE